ncbi:MAG: alpha/beta hydrolase [Chloroflexota bacterium]|nr:alpha/beta hydrolase [Chloroflexota bacterium]
MTTLNQPTTHTLDVPGAILAYDVRSAASSAAPPLFMLASPMSAAAFGTLASHFADRMVVTYDPRGVERSTKSEPTAESTPEQHADDLHRIIQAIGAGPVDMFATSGGAVNALELVARHPDDVRTLVAHEPPAAAVLPDRDAALAACHAVQATYRRSGWGAGMAHFIATATHRGEYPDDYAERPGPDPAMFGMPAQDDGSRADPLLGQNMLTCVQHEHDFDALRRASTRIVVGVGAESEGEMAHRAGVAVAERLGTAPVTFPGGHAGFLGGEYGQNGDPAAFAATLRKVIRPPA